MPDLSNLLDKGKTWAEALTSIKSRAFFAWAICFFLLQTLALGFSPDWGVVVRLEVLATLLTCVYMVAQKWEDSSKVRAAGDALKNGSGETPQ